MKELIRELESRTYEEGIISNEEGFLLTYKYVSYFYNSKKFYSLNNSYDLEDLVQEIYCKFLAKNLFSKYNSSITSKKYHIMNSVKNSLIDMLRKYRETVSLDKKLQDDEDGSLYTVLSTNEDVEGSVIESNFISELLESLSDETNSKVIGYTPLMGEVKMTERCIGMHLVNGYTVTEMSEWFINPNNKKPVSKSSISSIVKKVRENLSINLAYLNR